MININNSCNNFYSNKSFFTNKNLSFKGHTGLEEYDKNDIPVLKHETRFFRDIQTKNFAVDYIKKHFGDKKNINIVVGACSTGEEAVTLSMMLDSMKDKVKILGIDLGEKAIEQANRRKYLLQNADITNPFVEIAVEKYNDSYLWYPPILPLTKEEKLQRKMFKDFFIPVQKANLEDFMDYSGIMELRHTANKCSKIFELKKDKALNCEFVQGDIFNLSNIAKGKKADVIFFSNALYHMVTETKYGDRVQKKNAREIMCKFAKILWDNLNKDGIVCLGECEHSQGVNTDLLKTIMKKQGFKIIKIPKKEPISDMYRSKHNQSYTENVFIKVT